MSVRTSRLARLRGTVRVWTILVSLLAAVLVAVVGLHALTDDAVDSSAVASIAGTSTLASMPATDSDMTTAVGFAEASSSSLADTDDALTCGVLALLCVAALAAALLAMRGRAAPGLEVAAVAPPAPAVHSNRDRSLFAGLVALSIFRI